MKKDPRRSLILIKLQTFTEAAIGGITAATLLKRILWYRCFPGNFPVIFLVKISKIFFTEQLPTTASAFIFFTATLLKLGIVNSVWKTSHEYCFSRNTKLRSTIQVYHFFLDRINFQCMFPLVYTVYCTRTTQCDLSLLLYIQYLFRHYDCYYC